MPSEDQDPIEEVDLGETRTMSNETEIFAHDIAREEFLGSDRRVENIKADARVEGNEVVVEVAGDVTRVDPHTKPVFQSAERYEQILRRTQDPKPAWKRTLGKAIPHVITLGTFGVVSYVGVNVIQSLNGITVNGDPMYVPGQQELLFTMFVLFFLAFGIQFALPRVIGGVRS